MRAVIQRVHQCAVRVGGELCGQIDRGLLVYLGIKGTDTLQDLEYLAEKIVHLRVFQDEQGKMNLSALDVGAEVMVVSQFTLYGDARRGRRPSYSEAADGSKAQEYYALMIERLRRQGLKVEQGRFAARMEVQYTNIGPVTLLLDSEKLF